MPGTRHCTRCQDFQRPFQHHHHSLHGHIWCQEILADAPEGYPKVAVQAWQAHGSELQALRVIVIEWHPVGPYAHTSQSPWRHLQLRLCLRQVAKNEWTRMGTARPHRCRQFRPQHKQDLMRQPHGHLHANDLIALRVHARH